jgi:hypothetical protein
LSTGLPTAKISLQVNILLFSETSHNLFFVPDRQKIDDVSFRSRMSPSGMNGAGYARSSFFILMAFEKNGMKTVFPHSHIPVPLGDAEEKGIFSLSLPPPPPQAPQHHPHF